MMRNSTFLSERSATPERPQRMRDSFGAVTSAPLVIRSRVASHAFEPVTVVVENGALVVRTKGKLRRTKPTAAKP